MNKDQKLVLESLSTKNRIVALWRRIQGTETGDADDEVVKEEIKVLEDYVPDEYRALKKLCEKDAGYSLGGLRLALVQAGMYIAQFECSFKEHQTIFNSATGKQHLQDIMKRIEDLTPIH